MTNKEKEMYEIIRHNPQISQNELAEKLGITRSSVSVHITNLIKKGYISGRGYILNEQDYTVVIGAANIDIIGVSKNAVIPKDSNPGNISFCPGGVARNIGENLARLGTDIKFISSICNDAFGRTIIEACEDVKMDMSHSFISQQGVTDSYLAIIDNDGDMNVALSDMSALELLPVEHLEKKRQLIQRAGAIVMDACLTEECIDYILSNFKDKKTFMDPVSIGKAKKIKHNIGRFYAMKCNTLEAAYLTDIPINNIDDCRRGAEILLEKGLKEIYISLGANGVYYDNGSESGHFKSVPIQPINTTGAGDAFMAGMVYCSLRNDSLYETARFSTALSLIALKGNDTVSKMVSLENVNKEIENMNL